MTAQADVSARKFVPAVFRQLTRAAGAVRRGDVRGRDQHRVEQIIETADTLDADLIVTGTRGTTGLRCLLQSSVADRVLRHGHRPVLVMPPGR